jgi:hypothetical protein
MYVHAFKKMMFWKYPDRNQTYYLYCSMPHGPKAEFLWTIINQKLGTKIKYNLQDVPGVNNLYNNQT